MGTEHRAFALTSIHSLSFFASYFQAKSHWVTQAQPQLVIPSPSRMRDYRQPPPRPAPLADFIQTQGFQCCPDAGISQHLFLFVTEHSQDGGLYSIAPKLPQLNKVTELSMINYSKPSSFIPPAHSFWVCPMCQVLFASRIHQWGERLTLVEFILSSPWQWNFRTVLMITTPFHQHFCFCLL